MSKINRQVGATSQILQVFIRNSASTTGGGLTGLVFNSASLTAYYHRDTDTTATVINLVTMTAGTFTSSGFKEIDSTNMPGWYQFCPPNAAFASGAASVAFHLQGAAGMAPLPVECDLDAQSDVRLWNGTAVATPATAGIPDVNTKNLGNTSQTGRDIGASVLLSAGTGTGQLDFTSGVVKANLVQILATALTETAGQIAAAFKQFFNIGSPTGTVNLIPAVTTVTTTTTATNLTNAPTAGDFTSTMKTSLNAATPASVTGAVGSVTGNVGGNVVGSVGSVTGAVGSVTGAVGSVTGNVGGNVVGSVASVTAGVTVTTNNDKTGYALTSAYDAAKTAAQDGDAMTLTSGERTTLAGVIWANASRTLTSFGTLVADVATAVWGAATRTLSAFGFTVTTDVSSTVTTNLDTTVSSRLATSGYTAPPTTAQNADELLGRNLAGGSSGGRTVTDALRPARNRVSIAGGTVTVYEEDDTTVAWTGALTTNPAAEPIVEVDPT